MPKHYGKFDAEGFPVAFYIDEAHGARMRPIYQVVDVFGVSDDGQSIKVGERKEPIGEEPNPDCTIPADAVEITAEQWLEFLNNNGRRRWVGGQVVVYDPPPPPVTQADYSAAIQALLDAKARERQYDGIHTAIGYRDDPNQNFAAEAQELFNWRSAVWTYSSAELAKVVAGQRPQPTVADFMAELEAACPFTWPMARPAMLGGQLLPPE